jgi:predicted enzyme related to lactoylglutathione lyase
MSSIYFEIQANEPQRATRFYNAVFGWNFVRDANVPIEYWRLDGGDYMGAVLQRPAPTPPQMCGTNAFVCSFQVEDFDSVAERVAQAGGRVAMAKFAIPGKCWHGYFLDTDGNAFGIFEVDESAA